MQGEKGAYLVVDLPYKTYETPSSAIENAGKLVDIEQMRSNMKE